MRGIFSNWYITTNFNFNIFILYEKHKNLNQRNPEGYFDAFLSQTDSTHAGSSFIYNSS